MVLVDTVYQRVLAIANKEQRGYITPQEFNLFANQAQMNIFEQYFYDLNQFGRLPGNDTAHADIVNILEEKIGIFEDSKLVMRFDTPPPTTDVFDGDKLSGYNLTQAIPDLYRISNVRVYRMQLDGSPGWRIVEKVSKKERYENQLGPLTRPTSLRPTYTIDQPGEDLLSGLSQGDTILRFQHDGDPSIAVDYIRKPEKVNWTYVVVNNKALYNGSDGNLQNFELHDSEETSLVTNILKIAGIAIKDQTLAVAAVNEDSNKIKQEKQ